MGDATSYQTLYIKLKKSSRHPGSDAEKGKYLGLLERPSIPLSTAEFKYRIFVAGCGGIGKSFLISWLSGFEPPLSYSPTPGIRTMITHCPAYIKYQMQKEVLFTLNFWESGGSGKITNADLYKNCPDNVDAVMLMFPCNERKSLEHIPKLIEDFKVSDTDIKPCFFAVGVGCHPQGESIVTINDLKQFEEIFSCAVITIPFISNISEVIMTFALKQRILAYICEKLWLRDKDIVQNKIS